MNSFHDDHEHVAEALAAYVLDALDEGEAVTVGAHLRECAACRDEFAELRAVVDQLPAATPQLAPPPELKARIMAEVEAEAQLLRAAQGPRADRPEQTGRRSILGWLALRPVAVGLGCTALLAAGFFVGISAKTNHPETTVASRTIPARVEHARAPRARAALVRRGEQVTLTVSALPNPPRGRIYQVWLKRPGQPIPVPTQARFTVNSHGDAYVAVPGDLRGVKNVLVTEEPHGGSAVPSQLPLISAPTS
jgi:anti-sigma-K factor RskA